ncbi:cyclin-P4-1-like [Phragmites australis]|uniref:cyclin-P4-1-like n=1 Tax=Phragmites australis TaxID=29695 RepID=UPI002D799E17|nr:cyclin-P4-1-like [Phragmites australis]
MATTYGAAPVPRVVAVLAGLLERAAERGDGEGSAGATAFRGRTRPGIAVRRYAERIYRYAGCSPACFVVAYVYLDRLAQRREEEEQAEVVDSYSVHRLLITTVMVAAKFMDDIHYNNAYFARVGGVLVSEMNGLELELLFALRFRLNVTPATFARYCAALEGEMTMEPAVQDPVPLPSPSPEEERRRDQALKDAAAATVASRAFAAAQRAVGITQ